MAKRWKKRQKTDEKNFNPTGKGIFALYECPNCHRNDCAVVPPNLRINLPFFVQCGCGNWVMYVRAWFTEPYSGGDILAGYVTGDKKILHALRHELKDATNEIAPNGTMGDPTAMMQKPGFFEAFEAYQKDEESKKVMYR